MTFQGMAAKLAVIILLGTSGCITQGIKPEAKFMKQGNQYAKDGLYRESAESYQKALKSDPTNLTAQRNLGMVLVKLGNYKEAVAALEVAIKGYDDEHDANFYLGEAYRGLEKYPEAIYRYQRALKAKTKSLKARRSLAWSYYQIKSYKDAQNVIQSAYDGSKKDLQTTIIYARILLKLNEMHKLTAVISRAKSTLKKEELPYIQSIEGDYFFAFGNCPKALESYKLALKSQPLLPNPLLGIGSCLLRDGQNTTAISFLERAIRAKPNMKEIYFLLGQAYQNQKDPKYVKYYRRFIAMAKGDPEHSRRIAQIKKHFASLRKEKASQVKQ